jgi:choline dehydrogenase-like flavoprotein
MTLSLNVQVIGAPKVYGVCIIGSGAVRGTAAKVLTEGGLEVVMLEAGTTLSSTESFVSWGVNFAAPLAGVIALAIIRLWGQRKHGS